MDAGAGAAASTAASSSSAAPAAAHAHLRLPAVLSRVLRHAALSARSGGGPFAAAVVRVADGKVVSLEGNCVTAACDPTAHGEVQAIRAAATALGSSSLAGCVLVSSCFPCPMCCGACMWARLDAIYYGATAADAAGAGFDDAAFHEQLRIEDGGQRRQPLLRLAAGAGEGDGAAEGDGDAAVSVLLPFATWHGVTDKTHY